MSGDSLQAEDTAAIAPWRVSLERDLVWFHGAVPTPINPEDIATAAAVF